MAYDESFKDYDTRNLIPNWAGKVLPLLSLVVMVGSIA